METIANLMLLLAKLSLLSVGGSPTVLGEMQREMVTRGWLTADQFATAFALTQVVPGPPVLLVIPLGYLTAGVAGALAALVAFSLPTTVIALIASRLWTQLRQSPWAVAARTAVGPVAAGLIIASVYTVGRSSVREADMLFLGVAMFFALWRTRLPAMAAVPIGVLFGVIASVIKAHNSGG